MPEHTSKHIHEYVCTASLHADEHNSVCIRTTTAHTFAFPNTRKKPSTASSKQNKCQDVHDAPKNPRHYVDELNIYKQIYIQSIYQLIYTDTYAKPLFARASIKTTLCMAHDNNTNISIAKQPKKKAPNQNHHTRGAHDGPKKNQRLCAKAHPCVTTWLHE